MVDIVTMVEVVNGLKSAQELLSNIFNSGKAKSLESELNSIQQAFVSVLGSATQAQLEQMKLMNEITSLKEINSSLEKEITKLKNWEAEKLDYETVKINTDAPLAYMKKDARKDYTQFPMYCATCFENNKKSVLNYINPGSSFGRTFQCMDCGFKYNKHNK